MSLFVAWMPDDGARGAIASLQQETRQALAGAAAALRWQPGPRLHMTLRYLGRRPGLDASALDLLAPALARMCEATPPCPARLDHCEAWRRVLVARAAPSEGLDRLFGRIEAVVTACGFPPEARAAAPHVTLAHGHLPADTELPRPAPATLGIGSVSLVESVGGAYRRLACWPLSGAGTAPA